MQAFESLSSIFHKVGQEGAWPIYGQLPSKAKYGNPVPVSLLDKPGGGDKPIGIIPVLSALFLKCQGEITTEWDESKMNFWEDAVKGSSALRAGLHRRLLDECAVAMGIPTLAVYWTLRNTMTASTGPRPSTGPWNLSSQRPCSR